MGRYPPDLLKGMARYVINAANTAQAPMAYMLYTRVSQRTGLDISVVRDKITQLADFDNQN